MKIEKCTCKHRQAYICYAPALWKSSPATVREIFCQADGDEYCLEEYRWTNKFQYKYLVLFPILSFIALFLIDGAENQVGDKYFYIPLVSFLIGFIVDTYLSNKVSEEFNQFQREELLLSFDKLEEKYNQLEVAHKTINEAYEELFVQQKSEMLKVLSGGIAHDFNNLITGMRGYVDFVSIEIRQGDEVDKILGHLEELGVALDKAKSLANQLMQFSRGGSPIKKPVSVAELLEENVRFSLSGSNVVCKFDFEEGLNAIGADKHQIGQMIGNLTLNAIQAMPEGGRLYVSARNIGSEDVLPKAHRVVEPGNYVVVTVQDEGKGIEKENLDEIFKPYFTTKSSGNGLGLASCYSIIKKHGGYIFADSTLGQGAKFSLYLPVASHEHQVENVADERPIFSEGHILVVEEDVTIQKLLRGMLKYLGYEVEVVKTGQEATELYQSNIESGKSFDLVVVDLMLPSTVGGGVALKKVLTQIDPNVKVVITSGYVDDAEMKNYKDYGFVAALEKPYGLTELSYCIYDSIGD